MTDTELLAAAPAPVGRLGDFYLAYARWMEKVNAHLGRPNTHCTHYDQWIEYTRHCSACRSAARRAAYRPAHVRLQNRRQYMRRLVVCPVCQERKMRPDSRMCRECYEREARFR